MTAPLQYGTQPAPDPTAVMGRRTLAWIADLLLFAAVVAAGFASMAEYVDIPAGIADEDACALLEAQNGDLPGGCIAVDGTAYLLDTGEAGIQTVLSLGWFALFVILQGITGGSPGKLLFGLRVVDQYGNRCGIGRSLGRTLMWVIDAAPWLIPLVGPITAFTSTGHRRVGDLAAGTFVVSSASVGAPVMPATAATPPGQQGCGAPPPGWGATPSGPPSATPSGPPSAPPTSSAPGSVTAPAPTPEPSSTGRWSSPAAEDGPDLDIRDLGAPPATEPVDQPAPTVEPDPDWSRPPDGGLGAPSPEPEWSAPTLPEVDDPAADWQPPTDPGLDPEPTPSPFVAPGADAPPPASGPAADGSAADGSPAPPRLELPPPQWDAARGTYLQWEPNQQAWLQWDAPAQRWKPIDT